MLYGVIGTLLAGAGVSCLYASWKNLFGGNRWLVPAGWFVLLVATAFWVMASGAEFGISVSLLVIPLIAWGVMLLKADIRPQRAQEWDLGRASLPDMNALLRHGGLFLASVLLAGAAAILSSVALVMLLPWTKVNAMVTAVILVPVLWGL
ncbi:MAG TPA: hypothetical protein VL987_10445, partial [Cellvibrio sp.]|nr:hypothetical protein [Cellvibrio sp.]